jgi:hypothetical protein
MPSHGTYLKDGLYVCENKDCATYREAPDGTPQFGMFTGGGNVPLLDDEGVVTGESEWQDGVCPTCFQPGVEISPETGKKVK